MIICKKLNLSFECQSLDCRGPNSQTIVVTVDSVDMKGWSTT